MWDLLKLLIFCTVICVLISLEHPIIAIIIYILIIIAIMYLASLGV